ncbi:MAG: hypothetical protein O3B24_03960, partial [Verrucomicrobia bacterium]|nr:hypothetical protein [Verrucomicrobiota bacterium]
LAGKLDTNAWATADATTNYVPRTGGAMTGTLTLPAGGLTVGTTQLVVLANGNVGIGISNPTNALAVNGTIKAREIVVTLSGWPDYVFDAGYPLMTLADTEAYIAKHGHLPGMLSAAEVEAGGVPVGDMQSRLLRKVEELTLHVIQLQKENTLLREALERGATAPESP